MQPQTNTSPTLIYKPCALKVTRGRRNPEDVNHFKVGGVDKCEGQNFDSSTPLPNTIHKNKPLCLKDHYVFVKKKAGHSNITFWIFIPFWALRADLEKGYRKKHLPSILVFGFDQAYFWPKLWLDTHSHSLHTPIHPSDILQTPSRHPPDTIRPPSKSVGIEHW